MAETLVRRCPSIDKQKIIGVEQRPGDRFEPVSIGQIDKLRCLLAAKIDSPPTPESNTPTCIDGNYP